MKICFFDFVTHLGGAQRSMAQILGWVSSEAEVRVLDAYGVLPEYRELVSAGSVQYEVLHGAPSFPTIGSKSRPVLRAIRAVKALPELLRVGIRVRERVAAFNPDLIHVISPKALRVITPALWACDYPIVYWCRGRFIPDVALRAVLSGRLAGALCLSEECKRDAVQKGIRPERVHVIPNGIDVGQINEAAANSVALPGEDYAIKILVPATLVPGKGHLCAIRALQRLVAAGFDAALYFAGDAPDGAPEYPELLRSVAKEVGVDARLFMLGWRADVLPIMRRCTAVVLPSRSEGMPRVVLEAAALRIPVAATRVGAIPELLDNGTGGWLFDTDDDRALAEALQAIITDGKERADRTAAAFARVMSVNDPGAITARYVRACGKLLAERIR